MRVTYTQVTTDYIRLHAWPLLLSSTLHHHKLHLPLRDKLNLREIFIRTLKNLKKFYMIRYRYFLNLLTLLRQMKY